MVFNKEAFTGRAGQLRILTIVAGVIALILTIDHYFRNKSEEEAFFGSIIACLICSSILFLATCLGFADNENARKLDKLFHVLAAILLIVTSCFFINSVHSIGNCRGTCKSVYARRAAAAAFGLLYGVLCGFAAFPL